MDKLQIKADGRDLKTSNPVKLRRVNKLPAVLYGNKVSNQNLTLDAREFDKIFKKAGESTIIDLVTGDGKSCPVLIHEVQYHYLTGVPIHVDFYQVSMTEKLKAKVVLEFTGEAPVVKTLGGVLVKVLNEVEVECLPADLPHNIPVDLAVLKAMTDSIFVKNLAVPAKVKITTPGEEMVIKVQPPRDVEAELAAPVVEDITKVAGAAEEKPAAEGEAKAGDKPEKAEKPAKGGAPSGGKEEKK